MRFCNQLPNPYSIYLYLHLDLYQYPLKTLWKARQIRSSAECDGKTESTLEKAVGRVYLADSPRLGSFGSPGSKTQSVSGGFTSNTERIN